MYNTGQLPSITVQTLWPGLCIYSGMEKRVFGVILASLGIIGLVVAAVLFMRGGGGAHHTRSLIVFILLGLIFFISGVGLVKNTTDKPT